MKVEYINPFIEAAQSVITMLCSVKTEIGKVHIRNSPFTANQVIIMIGVTGTIKGQVCFEMSQETGCNIASAMMGGMPVEGLDEISKSAIAEMGNMIMGNTSTVFYNNGIHVDITPPSLLTGDGIEISNKVPTIVVPLDLGPIGSIQINITANEAIS